MHSGHLRDPSLETIISTVNLNSKYFDSIRIKSQKGKAAESAVRTCAWEGCSAKAPHRAPKGRNQEGQFPWFCTDHIRDYNKNYNFFSEMNDEEIQKVVTDRTQGRPTWDMGVNKIGKDTDEVPRPRTKKKKNHDPSNVFRRYARMQQGSSGPNRSAERKILEADKKALEMLGVSPTSTAEHIKKAYKDLVKKHHPDINGGDKSSEERLRNIVTAYNHLKSKGFV